MSEQIVVLNVTGMNCNGCAASVERSLKKVDGVSAVRVDLGQEQAQVTYDASRVQLDALKASVVQAGYGIAEPA